MDSPEQAGGPASCPGRPRKQLKLPWLGRAPSPGAGRKALCLSALRLAPFHPADLLLSAEVSGGDRLDCVKASDQCLKEQSCSTKYRTLRQCVAGKETNFSLASGLEAKDECRSAMEALKQKSLYNCRCKRGMKKEKNCLRIYWSMYQSLQGTRQLSPTSCPGPFPEAGGPRGPLAPPADLILHSLLPSCGMRTFHWPLGTVAAGVCCC